MNTKIHIQPKFGITPEAFDAVDVGASLGNSFALIDNHVNPTQVKRSISIPVIGVVKATGRGVFGDQWQDLSSASGRHRESDNLPVSLEDAENDRLSGSSPAAVSWAVSTKHGFIHLERSTVWTEQLKAVLVQTDPEQLVEALHGLLAHAHQKAKTVGRHSQAEVIDQPDLMLSAKSAQLSECFFGSGGLKI